MFKEYEDKINELKSSDNHFKAIYDKHTELDKEIVIMKRNYVNDIEVNVKKKEKLKLKEEIYKILQSR